MNLMQIPQGLRWLIFSALGIILLIVLFFAEENWRGKRDFENCKRELETKGQTLDWSAYLPLPVPDAQNFYKAPKMAEWFIKSRASNAVNALVKRLEYKNTNSVVMAEVVMAGLSQNANQVVGNPDLVLRYSASGPAVFLPSTNDAINNASPDVLMPTIQFFDVPLTVAIESLARNSNVKYQLDPKIGYNQPDNDGRIKPEPTVNVRWDKITLFQSLQALLNQYGLHFQPGSGTNMGLITTRNPCSPQIFVSSESDQKIKKILQDVMGRSLVGPQTGALLTNSPANIKPARIAIQSEKPLDIKELNKLFAQLYPRNDIRAGTPRIHTEPLGTNSFQILVDAVKADEYLAWSDQFKPEFDTLRAALKRPYARLDGDYSQFFNVPIPDFVAMRAVIRMLAQRAQCELLLGKPDKALQELKLLHDFRQVLEARPSGKMMTVVAAMINTAIAGVYAETIADGLRLHVWQEPQLVAIQNQLYEIYLIPFLVESLKAEAAGFSHWVYTIWIKQSGIFTCRLYSLRIPVGWAYQNLVNVARLNRLVLDGIETTNGWISPRLCDKAANEIDRFFKNDTLWKKIKFPLKAMAAIVIPNFVNAERTTALNQTLINEAQIACALERYHLVHGEYPASLNALQPKFIDRIPQDIIGGESLKYRRREDGQFLLYSVGWNELDENGLVMESTGNTRFDGDWVWPGR